jgi:hypothetical protein
MKMSLLKTLSPLECQASEILTNYALKLTQEQLLQPTSYLCVELLVDSRYVIYKYLFLL